MSRIDLAISEEGLVPRAPQELAVELLKQIGLETQPAEAHLAVELQTAHASSIPEATTSSALLDLPHTGFNALRTCHLMMVVASCTCILLLYTALVAAVAALLFIALHEFDVQSLTVTKLPEWAPLLVKAILSSAGGFILFFLAKPLLTVRRREEPAVKLDQIQEQKLWALVVPLCQAMKVKIPTQLYLTNEVDAKVHLASGWRGFLKGDLALTLGLPLVAGLTQQQLLGALAHEFGHCTQRVDMRCYYFINFCNAWLDQRAHFRDAWGERLKYLSEVETSRLTSLGVLVARFGMRLPRQLLHYCFLLSYRLSKPACRQLELDADRYTVLVAGSEIFRSTALHLHAIRWAFRQADRQNVAIWSEGALLADMPKAAALGATQLDMETQRRLEAKLRDRQRYWRAHPADIERVQTAEALNAPALVENSAPAAELFEYFSQYCQQVTTAYYQKLGLDVSLTQLREASSTKALGTGDTHGTASLKEWSFNQWTDLPWLPLHISANKDVSTKDWQAVVSTLKSSANEIGLNWQQAQREVQRRFTLAYCDELNAHHITNHINGVDTFDSERYLTEYRSIDTWQSPARVALLEVAALFRQRIRYALKSHYSGHVQSQELATLLFALTELYPDYERLRESHLLVKEYNSLHRLQGSMETHQLSHYALLDFRVRALRLVKRADQIKQSILPGGSIGGYLKQQCPYLEMETGAPISFYQKSDALFESFAHCYQLTFAQLSKWCIEAETANQIH